MTDLLGIDDSKPILDDSKHKPGDSKPILDDSKRKPGDSKPILDDSKHKPGDSKPGVDDSKPRADGSRVVKVLSMPSPTNFCVLYIDQINYSFRCITILHGTTIQPGFWLTDKPTATGFKLEIFELPGLKSHWHSIP